MADDIQLHALDSDGPDAQWELSPGTEPFLSTCGKQLNQMCKATPGTSRVGKRSGPFQGVLERDATDRFQKLQNGVCHADIDAEGS